MVCMTDNKIIIFFTWLNTPTEPGPPHYPGFAITLSHTTVGKTPLDEGLARRRDLYPTTHNIHMRQTSMPLAGFEPTIPASVRPQTHALDRAATGIGITIYVLYNLLFFTVLIMRGYKLTKI